VMIARVNGLEMIFLKLFFSVDQRLANLLVWSCPLSVSEVSDLPWK